MKPPSPAIETAAPRARPRNGFALVVALGLMGMLVLLMVSLVAITQSQQATIPIREAQAEARAIALVALNEALAQLQNANPLFPALRSDPMALSESSRRKQTPSSNPPEDPA